jgi:hypothetical protein
MQKQLTYTGILTNLISKNSREKQPIYSDKVKNKYKIQIKIKPIKKFKKQKKIKIKININLLIKNLI